MARFININNSASVAFTNRLEKMRKHDLPVVINQTLNDAAFDVKLRTMPRLASQTFTERNKSFFRSTSRVRKSSGFSISRQFSEVGFQGTGTKAGAVAGLAKQERGGTMKERDFTPTDDGRTGKKLSGNVQAKNRLNANQYIDVKKTKGGTKKGRFVRAAMAGKKTGKLVIGNFVGKNGTRTVSRIRVAKKTKGGIVIKRTIVATFKEGRTYNVKAKNFMRRASNESGLKIDNFFIKNAKKRIKLK